jgi:hypothetical protein
MLLKLGKAIKYVFLPIGILGGLIASMSDIQSLCINNQKGMIHAACDAIAPYATELGLAVEAQAPAAPKAAQAQTAPMPVATKFVLPANGAVRIYLSHSNAGEYDGGIVRLLAEQLESSGFVVSKTAEESDFRIEVSSVAQRSYIVPPNPESPNGSWNGAMEFSTKIYALGTDGTSRLVAAEQFSHEASASSENEAKEASRRAALTQAAQSLFEKIKSVVAASST